MPTRLVQLKNFNGTDLRPYMVGMNSRDNGAQGKATEFALEDLYPEHFNKQEGPDYPSFGKHGLEVKTKQRFALPTSYTTICHVSENYIGCKFEELPITAQNKILADRLFVHLGDLTVDSHEFIYYDNERRDMLKQRFTDLNRILENNFKHSSSKDGFLLEHKYGGTIEFRVQNKRMKKFHQSLHTAVCFNDLFERV
jgi:hypothetical protein